MQIQDIQADIAFGEKIAMQGKVILNQDQIIKEAKIEIEKLKNTNTTLAGLLKDAQERNKVLEEQLAGGKPPLEPVQGQAESKPAE